VKVKNRAAQLFHSELGNLFRVVRAGGVDVDHFACDDLANRVVAIHQVETVQCEREGPVEPFDFFRLDLAVPDDPGPKGDLTRELGFRMKNPRVRRRGVP
jgi:hypothetical protein